MAESNSLKETYCQEMMVYPLHLPLLSDGGEHAEARALSWKAGELSYSELHMRVTNIARRLAQLGCGEGERVAILLPKTPEFVQAIYSVLAAGCAYIPLDASAPASRIQKILSVGTPCRLITCEQLADSITPLVDCPVTVLALDADGDGLLRALDLEVDALDSAAVDSLPEPGLDNTAAMLFTSGSTGTPKGVELTHRNIGGFVAWSVQRFSMTAKDRLISLAPFHFDLSTLDLFATASVYGGLHLIDEPTLRFPAAISLQLQQQGITMCYAAPTVWSMLESHGRLHQVDLSALRLALFAGEVFPIAALRKVMEKLPHPRYFNLYGPTETNVCTYYEVCEVPGPDDTFIPIGLPCEHLEVIIRDEDGRALSAPGEQGEICVFGDAVTVGYFGMPEATAAARVEGREDSYRTGDLGCWDETGNIKFLGRKDNQVKIRGNRIELSEIESVICSHESVAECVVQLHDGDEGGAIEYRLVANVVPDKPGLDAETLSAYCSKHLTAVAVPTEVSFFDSFPRTSTGKIDRLKVAEAAGVSRKPN